MAANKHLVLPGLRKMRKWDLYIICIMHYWSALIQINVSMIEERRTWYFKAFEETWKGNSIKFHFSSKLNFPLNSLCYTADLRFNSPPPSVIYSTSIHFQHLHKPSLWWQQAKQHKPDIPLFSHILHILLGVLRHPQARWDMQSLQHLWGLPRHLLPVGQTRIPGGLLPIRQPNRWN